MKLQHIISVIIMISLTISLQDTYSNTPQPSYIKNSIWERTNNHISNNKTKERAFDLDDEGILVNDPIYFLNKSIFKLNDKIYSYVIKPLVTNYNLIVPLPARIAIKNLFHNIGMPARFVKFIIIKF